MGIIVLGYLTRKYSGEAKSAWRQPFGDDGADFVSSILYLLLGDRKMSGLRGGD